MARLQPSGDEASLTCPPGRFPRSTAESDPDAPLRPCAADTPAHASAREAFDALDALVAELEPTASGRAFNDALGALLDHECFALANRDLEVESLAVDSALAARALWAEGADLWLASYLGLGGGVEDPARVSYVVPVRRPTVARECAPAHPLAPLMCPAGDEACAATTRPFRARADIYFHMWSQRADPDGGARPRTPDVCAARAQAAPPDEGYTVWRACLERVEPRVTRLPVGGFARPTRGWLVVQGRRGHYNFCDEVRAYDLATGAFYVAGTCSGLVLLPGGSVDHEETERRGEQELAAGRLPLDALREAAWAIVTAEATAEGRRPVWGMELPDGVEPMRSWEGEIASGSHYSLSSDLTLVRWCLQLDETRSPACGRLTWPEDLDDAARDHAVKLLHIAELGLEGTCAPAALPAWAPVPPPRGGVSRLDATGPQLRRSHDRALAALSERAATLRCPERGGRDGD
ncbi:MAG: hypothetical protein AAGH15_17820 [Myxococcota bacterium]